MDFTLKEYKLLLDNFIDRNYRFLSFKDYLSNKNSFKDCHFVILRHDVDDKPENSYKMAQLESEMGILGSYYFRAVPCSWNENIIKNISNLGHEIGYHYETMDTSDGNIEAAWVQFKNHLNELRNIVNVYTICMHGSPKSKFDNKEIWSKYDYRKLEIIGEPYYDIPFNEVFYLTDTGRMWDGYKVSVRDKVKQQKIWVENGLTYHSTKEIIKSLKNNTFPKQLMINLHPQRWNSNFYPWLKELVVQSCKNQIKRIIIKANTNK